MGIKDALSWLNPFAKKERAIEEKPNLASEISQPKVSAYSGNWVSGTNSGPVYPIRWSGEKNEGQVGPMIAYYNDPYAMRIRSKQAYKENEFIQGVINKCTSWVVGTGLNLKCEPQMGVVTDSETFNKDVENFFKVYSNSKLGDISGEKSFNELQAEAFMESLHGDILVVLRVIDGIVKTQHIESSNVMNPPGIGSISISGDYILENKNIIRCGVEIDQNGKHIAYHVRNNITEFQRILAYEPKSGLRLAFMVYGPREVNATRGMSKIASAIEMAKKTEMYSSYALSSAKGRQHVAFTLEKVIGGSDEDPMIGQRVKANRGVKGSQDANPNDGLSTDINGIDLTENKTTIGGNTVYNLAEGQKLVMHSSEMEANVEAFCMFHYKVIAMMFGMPICVAMSEYNDSFSASRMAAKDWEATFMVLRQTFSQQYCNPIFALQMYVLVNMNKIEAPGLIGFYKNKDVIKIEAYLFCRWVGQSMPDIDPAKTIKYIREALGAGGKHIPLMTNETAAELIGQGDILSIIKQVGKEMEEAEIAGIEKEDLITGVPETDTEETAEKPTPKKVQKVKAK